MPSNLITKKHYAELPKPKTNTPLKQQYLQMVSSMGRIYVPPYMCCIPFQTSVYTHTQFEHRRCCRTNIFKFSQFIHLIIHEIRVLAARLEGEPKFKKPHLQFITVELRYHFDRSTYLGTTWQMAKTIWSVGGVIHILYLWSHEMHNFARITSMFRK